MDENIVYFSETVEDVSADPLAETLNAELARLIDLRNRHEGAEGHLNEWLDHDIDLLRRRQDWLRDFRARLDVAVAAPGGHRAASQN